MYKNPWMICICSSSFFCFEFFQINMFNSLNTELMLSFNINGEILSLLSSVYFWGVVLLLIPAGILLDYISIRKLMLSSMLLSLIGTLIFVTSTNFKIAMLGRFIVGVSGGPFCLLSAIKLTSRWFPDNKTAFITGIIISIGMIGGVIAQTPLTIMVNNFGWRFSLYINIIVGMIIFILLYIFVHDNSEKPINKKGGFIKELKDVIFNLQNWYCGIFASLLNLPVFLLGALWGNLYLTQVHRISKVNSSIIMTMIYLGMLIGSPLFGKVSDNINLRKAPMIIGAIICFLSTIIVINLLSLDTWSLGILFFLIGFGSSSQIIVYSMISENNPLHLNGTSEGLGGMMIMSGGAIFQPIFGWLIHKDWNGELIDNVAIYSANNFNNAMSLLQLSIFFCFIVAFFIKETNCTRKYIANRQ